MELHDGVICSKGDITESYMKNGIMYICPPHKKGFKFLDNFNNYPHIDLGVQISP